MLIGHVMLTPVLAVASPAWWAVSLVGLVLVGLGGFAIGQWRARTATQRAIERAKSSMANLYTHACQSVDDARLACQWLQDYPNLQLSLDQVQALDAKQALFLETVQALIEGQFQPVEEPEVAEVPEMNWVREPQSLVTKLPDRGALDANLELLIELANGGGHESAVMLARIDKVDDLKARFGIAGIQEFQRKMTSLICRAMRDADIVCQFQTDGFAVLIPGVDQTEAHSVCESIRAAIRGHNFRLKSGKEVLVTASFGATPVHNGDNADCILNRAENALNTSRRQGRNQLHLDTGSQLVACKA